MRTTCCAQHYSIITEVERKLKILSTKQLIYVTDPYQDIMHSLEIIMTKTTSTMQNAYVKQETEFYIHNKTTI